MNGCVRFKFVPVIHLCPKACTGVNLFSGSQTKHLLRKSMKSSSVHLSIWSKVLLEGFLDRLCGKGLKLELKKTSPLPAF